MCPFYFMVTFAALATLTFFDCAVDGCYDVVIMPYSRVSFVVRGLSSPFVTCDDVVLLAPRLPGC